MPDHPRNTIQVNIRLDKDVVTMLGLKAVENNVPAVSTGRVGGITEYIRRLIYSDLGMRVPEDPHSRRGRKLAYHNRVRKKSWNANSPWSTLRFTAGYFRILV